MVTRHIMFYPKIWITRTLWVTASRRHVAPTLGNFAGFGQPERGIATQTHLPPPPENRYAQHPLRTAVSLFFARILYPPKYPP
jgi:hypothetical protein